ncbi:MAG: hypothetical protein QG666_1227, partial [Euryarchaeota archaeon]|nr:hypothetical protein [Euryarchaeota archaeon]
VADAKSSSAFSIRMGVSLAAVSKTISIIVTFVALHPLLMMV